MSVSALRRSGTVLVGTVLLVMVPASLGGAEQATTRDIQALLERAENATQAGHYDQAEEAYKRFLEIQPDVPTVLNNLGSVFLRTGRYHGAVEYFKRARNLDGNLFQVRLNLAICLYRLERYSEARKEFELYLREDPQNYQANYLAGIVSFSLNDFPVAVNYLERILTARKPDSALLFTLATSYARTKQPEKARSMVDRLFAQPQDTPQFHLLMGQIHFDRHDYKKALSEFNRAAEGANTLTLVHYWQGLALLAAGRASDAESEFREEIKLNPNDPESLFYMGYILRKAGDCKGAVSFFQRAIRNASGPAPGALSELGKCYIELGDTQAGIKSLREALAFEPNDSRNCYVLGTALVKLGREREGRSYLQKVREILAQKREIERSRFSNPLRMAP